MRAGKAPYAGVLVIVAGLAFWIRPAPPIALDPATAPPAADPTVSGVFHVHSTRSDGAGSLSAIAAAAAAAGLQFVVFADHGDGTRPLEPPSYQSGVLCIDGVEISTTGGHYIAIGMERAPYPLGGEGRDVVEDVRRLGGFGIVAHPDSAKPELRWSAWESAFDAIEWMNADSEWRNDGYTSLARSALQYLFRPPQALASLLDRPVETIRRWDELTARRRVPALAGSDAHARIAWGGGEREDDVVLARLPTYDAAFRLFSNRVVVPKPFTGDAAHDAELLLDGLRNGRVHTVVDALASPSSSFAFRARSGGRSATEGERLELAGPVTLEVAAHVPATARTVLLRGSQPVADMAGGTLTFETPPRPAVYRVEIHVPSAPGRPPVPWLLSNPIYVGGADEAPAIEIAKAVMDARNLTGPSDVWQIERDPSSSGAVAVDAAAGQPRVSFEYTLGAGVPKEQYAAFVHPLAGGLSGFDRVAFRASADREVRLSVQLRLSDGTRWRRSFYADPRPIEIQIPIADMRRVDGDDGGPDLSKVDAILFVVDLTNSRPGDSGRLIVESPTIERTTSVR